MPAGLNKPLTIVHIILYALPNRATLSPTSSPTPSSETCFLRGEDTTAIPFFNIPEDGHGIAVDTRRNLIYVSFDDHVIRSVNITDRSRMILVGSKEEPGDSDGSYSVARFNRPWGLEYDERNDLLYVADSVNGKIRVIDPENRQVHTLASNSSWVPTDVTLGTEQRLFVPDWKNDVVATVNTSSGRISILAGSGAKGHTDGPATSAKFSYPQFSAVLGECLFVSNDPSAVDAYVRRINVDSGNVSTLIGPGQITQPIDGPLSSAQMSLVTGLAIDDRCSVLYLSLTQEVHAVDLQSNTMHLTAKYKASSAGFQGMALRKLPNGDAELFGTALKVEPHSLQQITTVLMAPPPSNTSGFKSTLVVTLVCVVVLGVFAANIILFKIYRMRRRLLSRLRRSVHEVQMEGNPEDGKNVGSQSCPNIDPKRVKILGEIDALEETRVYNDYKLNKCQLDDAQHRGTALILTPRSDGTSASFAGRLLLFDRYHQIRHQNIQKLFGMVTPKSKVCLLAEFISERTVASCHKSGRFTDKDRFVDLAKDICCGLFHLHKMNIVYSDVSCRNFLIKGNGKIVLAYHSLIKSLPDSQGFKTPAQIFKSPAADEKKLDIRSFGGALFEIATEGRMSFRDLSGSTDPDKLPLFKEIERELKTENAELLEYKCPLLLQMLEKCINPNPEAGFCVSELLKMLPQNALSCIEAEHQRNLGTQAAVGLNDAHAEEKEPSCRFEKLPLHAHRSMATPRDNLIPEKGRELVGMHVIGENISDQPLPDIRYMPQLSEGHADPPGIGPMNDDDDYTGKG